MSKKDKDSIVDDEDDSEEIEEQNAKPENKRQIYADV